MLGQHHYVNLSSDSDEETRETSRITPLLNRIDELEKYNKSGLHKHMNDVFDYLGRVKQSTCPDITECVICQNKMLKTQKHIKLSCGHAFHPLCVARWLIEAPQCPVCRDLVIFDIDKKHEEERAEFNLQENQTREALRYGETREYKQLLESPEYVQIMTLRINDMTLYELDTLHELPNELYRLVCRRQSILRKEVHRNKLRNMTIEGLEHHKRVNDLNDEMIIFINALIVEKSTPILSDREYTLLTIQEGDEREKISEDEDETYDDLFDTPEYRAIRIHRNIQHYKQTFKTVSAAQIRRDIELLRPSPEEMEFFEKLISSKLEQEQQEEQEEQRRKAKAREFVRNIYENYVKPYTETIQMKDITPSTFEEITKKISKLYNNHITAEGWYNWSGKVGCCNPYARRFWSDIIPQGTKLYSKLCTTKNKRISEVADAYERANGRKTHKERLRGRN
jgi:hypothetical protein